MILTRPLEDFRIWAPDVIVLDRDRKYEQVQSAKPHGLWFSVQADWDSCVRGDGMDWTSSCVMHKVDVRPVSELLHITSPAELVAFTREYEGQPPSQNGYRYATERNYIDWPRVAAAYPGIVIQPYVWECRLEPNTSWYYGWDCASGVVWDLDYVRSVIPICLKTLPASKEILS